MELPIVTRRVQKILSNTANLRYRLMFKKPAIAPKNKQERLEFAHRYVRKGDYFRMKTKFSDEEQFYLDGPVNVKCYWRSQEITKKVVKKTEWWRL